MDKPINNSTAVVTTKSGGAFRIYNAFMLGMDHIVGNKKTFFNTEEFVYEIQDGDNIVFV